MTALRICGDQRRYTSGITFTTLELCVEYIAKSLLKTGYHCDAPVVQTYQFCRSSYIYTVDSFDFAAKHKATDGDVALSFTFRRSVPYSNKRSRLLRVRYSSIRYLEHKCHFIFSVTCYQSLTRKLLLPTAGRKELLGWSQEAIGRLRLGQQPTPALAPVQGPVRPVTTVILANSYVRSQCTKNCDSATGRRTAQGSIQPSHQGIRRPPCIWFTGIRGNRSSLRLGYACGQVRSYSCFSMQYGVRLLDFPSKED